MKNLIRYHASLIQGVWGLMGESPAAGLFGLLLVLINVVAIGTIVAIAQELIRFVF